jgi:aquaporin related protein
MNQDMAYKNRAEEVEDRDLLVRHVQHLNELQAHLVATMGEFVGTFFFLFFGYAGHMMVLEQSSPTTATVATPGILQTVFVSYAYGFSLLVTVWAFYRISGGLFNPAVCFPVGVNMSCSVD